ncbi:oligoendopeptidase F [Chloroflexota bacterium]
MTNPLPHRSEIDPKHTWNAESVYPNIQAWEKELDSILGELDALAKYQGKIDQSPILLAEALEKRDSLLQRSDIALMFANMNHEVDKTTPETAKMPGRAQGVYSQVLAAAAFIEPGLIDISQETVQSWLDSEDRLAIYAHYFEDLFRKHAHIRSVEVEELLGILNDPFSSTGNTAGILVDGEFKYEPAVSSNGALVEFNSGSLTKIYASPDRELRRSAYINYTDTFLAFQNTLASNLITSIKQNVFLSNARRHTSTLKASLYEHNIPIEVFHNLIKTFQTNLPTWHRYFSVKKKALGVEKLEPYDMWAPLTQKNWQIPYEQAIEWICQGLEPMGAEYVGTIRKGSLEQRWVDIYPNQGKTAGAFSYGSKGTYPFIVMSYSGELINLSTLAHELGHSMHSFLTWETQPQIYSDYSLFIAEVASNFQQAMVRSYLFDINQEREFQIALIEEAMSNFYRYFLIMPTLARFELDIHQRAEQGESLGADVMNECMVSLFEEAYGGQVNIDRQRVGITWATFGHLYEDYYVYQYATGISGAHALAKRIIEKEPNAVRDYLTFLKSGSSLYPLDALKIAGVDLTSPAPVEATFAVLADLVDRLETLLS